MEQELEIMVLMLGQRKSDFGLDHLYPPSSWIRVRLFSFCIL